MINRKIVIFSFYSLLYIIYFHIFGNFNLNGMTDDTYYLSAMYNYWNLSTMKMAIDGGAYKNFLANHFDPFLIILSPLAGMFRFPIDLLNFINYIFITSWVSVSSYLFFKLRGSRNFYQLLIFYIMFFVSITILFNSFINFNGLHSVLFAMPFLTVAYYYLFIKSDIKKSFIFFLPTLLIKEEFWLLFVFFNIALFFYSKEKKYLLLSFLSVILFYILFFKFMPYLNGDKGNSHGGLYTYIFHAKSIKDILIGIIHLPDISKRIILLVSFFIPFLVLIKPFEISKKDLLASSVIILPTIGYSFLAANSVMSYFLFEHYSMPIVPVLFALFIKYADLKVIKILSYLILNIIFIFGVLFFKEPWQYKYYQDEKQLITRILPKLASDIKYSDFILADDKTGVYFSNYQIDYLVNVNMTYENQNAQYVVINTRYVYLINKKKNGESSYEYLSSLNNFQNYKVVYIQYPFIVFKKQINSLPALNKQLLNSWDRLSDESNKWWTY